jgi:hypothetical protein
MNLWIDNIAWGNPSEAYIETLMKNGAFDNVIPSLKEFPFPSNSCEATQDEIRELMQLQNSPDQKNTNLVLKYHDYDTNFEEFFKKFCRDTIGENMDELIDNLMEDSKTIIMKLKYFYNRPRPFQLAYYYKAKLVPYTSKTDNSPSYPSGHAFQSHLLSEVIGSKHPMFYQDLKNLAHDVTLSRMFLGLHFASDCEFSIICVNRLIQDKLFTKEYGI